MLHTLKQRPLLIAGCCACSLAVGLALGAGSLWLSREPQQQIRMQPSAGSVGSSSSPAKTADGRLIHPSTGKACPIGTKPTGRSGCAADCSDGTFYWEDARQCIPVSEAKTACEGKGGTWIAGNANEEDRCRVPLTEIDPAVRRKFDRLGR